jgi:plasmid stability protein
MLSSVISQEEVVTMASVVVRGLDESVKKQLAAQAKGHGRSMEAEIRAILTDAVRKPHIGLALMQAAHEAGGFDDLPVPERTDVARAADFG